MTTDTTASLRVTGTGSEMYGPAIEKSFFALLGIAAFAGRALIEGLLWIGRWLFAHLQWVS